MRVLFVNPNYFEEIYGGFAVKSAAERGHPMPLGMGLLAAGLRKAGHEAEILDMNINDLPAQDLDAKVRDFRPGLVCFTMTTPLYSVIKRAVGRLHDGGYKGLVAVGGPHVTALPREVIEGMPVDFAVVGQGDVLIRKLAEGQVDLRNIWRKVDGKGVEGTQELAEPIVLDELPYAFYNPADVSKYVLSPLYTKANPVAFLETSRGCFSHCVFCNKNIGGYKLVAKNPCRVVDEMEYLLGLGYRELHIIDDGFATDKNRVVAICDEIIRRRLELSWYPRGGIRVDRVDQRMFDKMREAGCYRVPFGVESGSQRVLDVIRKGIRLEQAENAIRLAKQAGLQTEAYFMIGLPSETVADVKASYDFATRTSPDYMKFAITVPLPGTKMFDDIKADGRLLTEDWDQYNFAKDPAKLYRHDVMDSKTIYDLYIKYNRAYYLRPRYILEKLVQGVKTGQLGFYARNGMKVLFRR